MTYPAIIDPNADKLAAASAMLAALEFYKKTNLDDPAGWCRADRDRFEVLAANAIATARAAGIKVGV